MSEREEILKGRVRVGRTACYQVSDRGKLVKKVSFIFADESVLTCNYSQFHFACGTDRDLTMEFTRGQVVVKGRRLALISRAIAEFRLVYLAESSDFHPNENDEPFIEKLAFHLKGTPPPVGSAAGMWHSETSLSANTKDRPDLAR